MIIYDITPKQHSYIGISPKFIGEYISDITTYIRDNPYFGTIVTNISLVGGWVEPLWKMRVRQLRWGNKPNHIWENKIDGNHSPPTRIPFHYPLLKDFAPGLFCFSSNGMRYESCLTDKFVNSGLFINLWHPPEPMTVPPILLDDFRVSRWWMLRDPWPCLIAGFLGIAKRQFWNSLYLA